MQRELDRWKGGTVEEGRYFRSGNNGRSTEVGKYTKNLQDSDILGGG